MKRFLSCLVFLLPSVIEAQNAPQDITSSVVVRHLHESGWASHELRLDLTATALLLSGPQQYTSSSNVTGYCVFPAEIPLENIITVQANAGRGLSGFTGVYSIRLHLEYKDKKGGTHSYTFIPDDAVQTYGEWSRGDQQPIRDFAAAAKYAVDLRVQQLKATAVPSTSVQASPPELVDPDTGEKLSSPDLGSERRVAAADVGPAGSDQQIPTGPVSYKAQMPWPHTIRTVNLWPVSPVDHSRLRVEAVDTKEVMIDIPLEDIEQVRVRQRVVIYADPTPGEVIIPLGPAHGTKVYELCLRMRTAGGKHVTSCFISDLAQCSRGFQCQEGDDQGRNVVSLETEINKAITVWSVGTKQSKK